MTELTAEMVVDGLIPSDLQMKPDGSAVAFVVAPVGRPDEHPASAIWLAPTDGAAPARRLTAGTVEDRSPRWSPDGDWLYFLSDRKDRGKAQIHRLPLAGGEADALTDWKAGIAEITPLTDGRTLAFLALNPAFEEEKERREKERDDSDLFGARWPIRRLHLFDLASRETRPVDALGDRHVAEVVSAPDGARLAIVTWPTPEMSHFGRDAELLLLDVRSGETSVVCALPHGGFSPAWGRNAASICFLSFQGRDLRGGFGLFATELPRGTPRLITADLPACPIALRGGRDHDPLALVAEGLDTGLYRFDAATQRLVLLCAFRGDARNVSACADGRVVALLRSTADEPPNVWGGPPDGPLVKLTDLRPELRDVALGRQERLTWTAADGLELDGLVILPPGKSGADGPFPLVTIVHGGPYGRFADALQLEWAPSGQWLATAGYAVFLPNPRGGLGHGHAFADTVAGAVGQEDWGDILSGIDRLIEQGVADADRLGIGGWSQGGFMTAWAVGQTDRFQAGVMGAGVSDWGMMVAESDIPYVEGMLGGSTGWEGPGPHRHDELSPISYAHRVTTPVLILHGEKDERVPVSQGRFFARALRERGVPFELVVYPREPHGLQERNHQLDALRRTRAWFDRWLRPELGQDG